MGAYEAVDGGGGERKDTEKTGGFLEVVDIGTEFGDLAGEDTHDVNFVFEGGDGGFIEPVEFALGDAAGVESVL